MALHSATVLRFVPALTALLLLLAALAVPASGGTPEGPEVTDASGDAGLPHLDIASAWFESNGTTLVVHVERGADAGTPPTAVQCQDGNCAGAGVSLRVVFTVLRPDGTPAPTLTDYASSYVLVRLGPNEAVTGFYDGEGTGTLKETVPVTIDGTAIEVAIPLSSEVVGLPHGPAAGHRIGTPYALSYAMPCAPVDGCRNVAPPDPEVSSFWDRAPDTGSGADYWLPAAAPAASSSSATTTSVAAATTVTVAQTQTRTVTHTATIDQTHTVTFQPNSESESKASPAAGLLVPLAVVALAAMRRRLA